MTVIEIPTPDPRTLDEDSRLFAEAVRDRYAIKRIIGRGGMGVVYLARDRRLERLVAIKTLPRHVGQDESVRQRFLREIRMAGALSHPNIVPIHGADECDGQAYFVMTYVDGDSLAGLIRAAGRLEPDQVARVLRDVAAALAHAHERGIIHRDVKAENILLERRSGRAMVTDFGVARLAEAAPLTATGQVLGTVYYTSPEQVCGEPLDGRSDLYSLGVVGFLALTGSFPFDGDLASAVLVAHVNKRAPGVRTVRAELPESLAAIIDRCLAKNPSDRFESAEALCGALDVVIRDGLQPVTPAEQERLSQTQANAVWERAAELQASSKTPSRQLPLTLVRDAGREAGIATRFMDRAIAERDAGSADARGRVSWWSGVPDETELRAVASREASPREFDRLLYILRVGTGQPGVTTAWRHEIAWRCEQQGMSLDASIVPSDGQTQILLRHTSRGMAAPVMLASLAAAPVLGWATTAAANVLIRFGVPGWMRDGLAPHLSRGDAEWIAIGLGAVVGLSVIPLARLLVRKLYRRAAARVAALRDALVANITG